MVGVAAKEPPRGGGGCERTSTWWWCPQKQNREERERRERGWSNGEGGGEALRGRGRGRQCTDLLREEETVATKGRRRSSSKAKGRNRGHARGEEFLCPKRRDTNAVVSGNRVCILLQNNLKIVLQIQTQLF